MSTIGQNLPTFPSQLFEKKNDQNISSFILAHELDHFDFLLIDFKDLDFDLFTNQCSNRGKFCHY